MISALSECIWSGYKSLWSQAPATNHFQSNPKSPSPGLSAFGIGTVRRPKSLNAVVSSPARLKNPRLSKPAESVTDPAQSDIPQAGCDLQVGPQRQRTDEAVIGPGIAECRRILDFPEQAAQAGDPAIACAESVERLCHFPGCFSTQRKLAVESGTAAGKVPQLLFCVRQQEDLVRGRSGDTGKARSARVVVLIAVPIQAPPQRPPIAPDRLDQVLARHHALIERHRGWSGTGLVHHQRCLVGKPSETGSESSLRIGPKPLSQFLSNLCLRHSSGRRPRLRPAGAAPPMSARPRPRPSCRRRPPAPSVVRS